MNCKEIECEGAVVARGWCRKHYSRWHKNGDPSTLLKERGHGHATEGTQSPTYLSWKNMRQRCLNPNHPRFADYGGRGIEIDPEWDRFTRFLEDVGERPEGMTLDRIDNDGNYEKDNMRWATPTEQNNNKRRAYAQV